MHFIADNICRSSAVTKCCVEKCTASLDLVIIMDSSGSIGIRNYIKQKTFLKSILPRMNVELNQTKVAIIDFNSRVTVPQRLETFEDLETTFSVLDSLRYTSINGFA